MNNLRILTNVRMFHLASEQEVILPVKQEEWKKLKEIWTKLENVNDTKRLPGPKGLSIHVLEREIVQLIFNYTLLML